jgi:hypothetical protein
MKRSTSTALARTRRQSKKSRTAPATAPLPARSRVLAARPAPSSPRAARSAYVNAFCAFLHSPAQ